jgi:HD-like signal output (HDOD) protein
MVTANVSESELIQVAAELPAAPRLAVELGQAIRNPRVDSREITALLRQDPALVARLIRIANSALYARAEPAGSLEEALACIGFQEMHRLVGAVAATQLAEQHLKHYGVDGETLRANSLFVAVIMEELANATGEDPRGAYTVGLLRSIGKLALDRLARGSTAIPPFSSSGETVFDTWETRHWGMDNCKAAGIILTHWRLPHETVIAVQHHYRPIGRHNPIIHLLSLSAGAADDRLYGLKGEVGYWKPTSENFAQAGINERGFQIACEKAQRVFQRLHSASR